MRCFEGLWACSRCVLGFVLVRLPGSSKPHWAPVPGWIARGPDLFGVCQASTSATPVSLCRSRCAWPQTPRPPEMAETSRDGPPKPDTKAALENLEAGALRETFANRAWSCARDVNYSCSDGCSCTCLGAPFVEVGRA